MTDSSPRLRLHPGATHYVSFSVILLYLSNAFDETITRRESAEALVYAIKYPRRTKLDKPPTRPLKGESILPDDVGATDGALAAALDPPGNVVPAMIELAADTAL